MHAAATKHAPLRFSRLIQNHGNVHAAATKHALLRFSRLIQITTICCPVSTRVPSACVAFAPFQRRQSSQLWKWHYRVARKWIEPTDDHKHILFTCVCTTLCSKQVSLIICTMLFCTKFLVSVRLKQNKQTTTKNNNNKTTRLPVQYDEVISTVLHSSRSFFLWFVRS